MGFWLDLVLMTVLESYMDPWWNPVSWRLSLEVTPKRAPMLHNMITLSGSFKPDRAKDFGRLRSTATYYFA